LKARKLLPHEFNASDTIGSELRSNLLNLFEDRFESRGLRKKDFCFSFVVSIKLGERFVHMKSRTIFKRITFRYRLIRERVATDSSYVGDARMVRTRPNVRLDFLDIA
jgi:hypothetical protein